MMSSGSRGIESKRNAERVFDRIHDCRGRTIHREFADALRAIRSVNIPQLLEEHANGRQVARCRHDVVRHLAVLHASILPDHFLIKAESDSLGNSPDDLPARQKRVQNFANFLQRDKVVH